jgi:hypothetical protein
LLSCFSHERLARVSSSSGKEPAVLIRVFDHLRRQWMGALALFLVLTGGVAYAAATIGSEDVIDNSLTTNDLKNNQAVKSADVRDDTLAGGGLTTADLAPGSVTGADVLDDTLGARQLAAVTTLGSSGLREFDVPPGGSAGVVLAASGPVRVISQCTQSAAGASRALIQVEGPAGGATISVDSTGPSGVNDVIGTNADQTLASFGPTTSAHFATGSYSVVMGNGPDPDLLMSGEVTVGVNMHGVDCVLGATGLG